MKIRFILVSVAVVIAAACAKVDFLEPSDPGGKDAPVKQGAVTFRAEAFSNGDTITKTSLTGDDSNGYNVVWSSGDDFRLLYKYARMYQYWGFLTYDITSNPGSTSAAFATTDTLRSKDFSQTFMAFYPAALVPDSITGSTSTVVGPLDWPAVQKYFSGTAARCPMVSSDNDPEGTFVFKNLGGLLRLTVKGSGSITAIRITANQKMSGSFRFSPAEGSGSSQLGTETAPGAIIMGENENEDGSITLDCGEGVQLSDTGIDFHFSIPAGTYTNFKVEFYDGELLRGTRTAKTDIIIERSRITRAAMTAPVLGPGQLLSVGLTKVVTTDSLIEMAAELAGEELGAFSDKLRFLFLFDLNIVPVHYTTTDVDGKLVAASGLIAYPDLSGSTFEGFKISHIVSIQHGTCDIDEAPSKQDLPMEILPAAVGLHRGTSAMELMLGDYFVACMADYLGYGATENSDLQHPYLHNKLTGSTCADLISATEEYISVCGLKVTTDKVDLVGYSQGGAATISTMLELLDRSEKTWTSRISSVWAGAGPYDIPAFMESFAQDTSYSRSCYIPYAMRGLAYGEHLDIDWDNVYNSSVGKSGKGGNQLEAELFSKTQVSTWTDEIGMDVTKILNPDFYTSGNDDIHLLLKAAEDNSVSNCTAPNATMKAKIKLYHSLGDDTVPYVCSTSLKEAWGLGSITELSPEDHVKAGAEFLLDFCGIYDLINSMGY